jgi:hypothetical protein
VACLQPLRIEDIPLFGASDLTVVAVDNGSALGTAESEMLGSDVVVACETEALWGRQ